MWIISNESYGITNEWIIVNYQFKMQQYTQATAQTQQSPSQTNAAEQQRYWSPKPKNGKALLITYMI